MKIPTQKGEHTCKCPYNEKRELTMGACFVLQANGGFQMQYVLAILSNGTQGPMPRNLQQMSSNLCQ